MTLQVNFNLVSGKQITLRMEETEFEGIKRALATNTREFVLELNIEGNNTIIFRTNIESITARLLCQ